RLTGAEPGAAMVAIAARGDAGGSAHASAPIDAEGRFEFANLPVGSWDLFYNGVFPGADPGGAKVAFLAAATVAAAANRETAVGLQFESLRGIDVGSLDCELGASRGDPRVTLRISRVVGEEEFEVAEVEQSWTAAPTGGLDLAAGALRLCPGVYRVRVFAPALSKSAQSSGQKPTVDTVVRL
ncbi:MAG: hypothetical protein KDC98_04015, partial [Planctomycetes bacterium]|nr:hypothetical protein [Planctomycetota bacterium]